MKYPEIASWLRNQLDRLDWTAADLARRVQVNKGRVSEWTSGKRRPSSQTCIRLADALGVDPDELLAVAGHRVSQQPLDDQKTRIIALIRRADLSPATMNGLEAMLRSYPALPDAPDNPEDQSP